MNHSLKIEMKSGGQYR